MAAGSSSRALVVVVVLLALLASSALGFVPAAPVALLRRRPLPAVVAASSAASRLGAGSSRPVAWRPPSSPTVLFSEATPAAEAANGLAEGEGVGQEEEEEEKEGKGAMQRLKRWWKKTAKIDRKKMAELGASAVCSYGLVSNLNYCGTLCAAKIIFEKKHGISPFAPGQWKAFLAIYGGLWAAMNFVRPLRVWIALGLTPYFDKLVERLRGQFRVKKSIALGITIFFVNVLGTFAFLGTGLYLSSVYTGVPLVLPFFHKAAAAGAA